MVQDLSSLNSISDSEFSSHITKDLEGVEEIRQDKLTLLSLRKKLGLIVAIFITPITAFIDFWLLFLRSSDDMVAGVTVAFLGALWWWVSAPKRQYARAYKEIILPRIAKMVGNLTYESKGRLLVDTLKDTKIVPKYNKHKCEDYFEGEYKGTTLKLSEIELIIERETGTGKNKRKTRKTVFDGIAFLIEVPKKFFGHTILKPNQIGMFEWFNEKTLGLERANLVSPEFEDIYDVYTNDQVEARYLVHPVMIQKYTDLAAQYDGKSLSAAYYEGNVLLMLPAKKNHFEPADIYTPATDIDALLDLKHELTALLSIVDELELVDKRRMQDKQRSI